MAVEAIQPQDLPVGAILGWIGQGGASWLQSFGWLICDGSAQPTAVYPDLATALGSTFGTPPAGTFYLPDLQAYFLRGCAHGSTVDPDASGRTALRSGGASGDNPGSYQVMATAPPKAAYRGSVPHLSEVNGDDHQAWGDECTDQGSTTLGTQVIGGDLETVPVNKSVYWIIKASSTVSGQTVLPPIGAVAPSFLAAVPAGSTWTLCDGHVVPPTDPTFTLLQQVLGTLNGVDAGGGVVLPDLRGYFLRGVDTTGRDRYLNERTYPGNPKQPDTLVGSVESCYTAPPSTAFQTSNFHYPSGSIGKTFSGWGGGEVLLDKSDKCNITVGLTNATDGNPGGDAETRPVNVSVVHWACASPQPSVDDGFEIGMLMAFAGVTAPPNSNWLLCNGTAIPSQFADLQKALGSSTLPDLRGYFLRGLDTSGTIDKNGSTRKLADTEPFSTAAPTHNTTSPFTTVFGQWQCNRQEVTGVTGRPYGAVNNSNDNTCTAGGDKETRPINVAVDFYIKAAS